jgi:benzoyl-CoA-dihydrodiol lyase
VLPGTGGLTRLVDKRKVRRDHADVFSTVAEGIKGKRAQEWRLVDGVHARSKFNETVAKRAQDLGNASTRAKASGEGMKLPELTVGRTHEGAVYTATYKYVTMKLDEKKRVAELEVRGPDHDAPKTAEEMRKLGASWWAVQAFRELDDAILDLRFNFLDVGLVIIRTKGDLDKVVAHDKALVSLAASDWLGKEIALLQKRVLKRVDVTSRSLFTLIEEGSCFAGSLLELALASDRVYMKDDEDNEDGIQVALSPANFGPLPMGNGLTRFQSRFLYDPKKAEELKGREGRMNTQDALKAGIVTIAPDAIDWDDEVRVAIEERAAMSPDAMTGMEASLRYGGPETLETKIFGRLSAWQNWIFTRPNATGQKGALTMYGKPERPEFDWRRA